MTTGKHLLPALAAIGTALAVSTPQTVEAQAPTAAETTTSEEASAQASEEITVTAASRISRAGFTAPTPTTIITAETIEQRGQTNISDVLLDMPELRASRTPATTSNTARGATSSPDLRGLGEVRTLLLIDGARAMPTQLNGVSDLSLVPTLLVDRVEVVTGGASASWGSDAVAGVVNLILKKEIDGIQGDVSYNITDEGDDKETRIGLAGGTDFANGRGHIVIGFDYVDNEGIGDNYNRDWGRLEYLTFNNPCAGPLGAPSSGAGCGGVANGYPQKVLTQHVVNFSNGSGTPGGLILGVAGGASASLVRQMFNPDGTLQAHPVGPAALTSSAQTVLSSYMPELSLSYNGLASPLLPPVERFAGLIRGSYDLTDAVTFDASFAASMFTGVSALGVSGFGGYAGSGQITIRADNPYLPAAVAALMPAGSSFLMRRRYSEVGPSDNIHHDTNFQLNAGLSGRFGETWSWDVRGITGENIFKQNFINQTIVGRSVLAADAVRVTAGNVGSSGLAIGTIACRSTLTSPTNGCVPVNMFGEGNISQAGFDYLLGVGTNKRKMWQDQVMADIQGDLFSTWAGPIAVAAGFEYRNQEVDVVSDPRSQANGFAVSAVNVKAMSAKYDVTEVYGEAVIPLAREAPLAEELDLTLAGRHTDYSTSGEVNTWKVGVSYRPFGDLRLRLTRSRDIRAPNLLELFSAANPASTPGFIIDPRTGLYPEAPPGAALQFISGGNEALLPELADTLTYGLVYQPSFIPGLSASIDYTHIEVEDAIGLVPVQILLDRCFINNDPTACNLITRGPGNSIASINSSYINLASLDFESIDWEVRYNFSLDSLWTGAPGDVHLGLLGSYNMHMIFDDGVTTPIDRAGEVGGGAVSALGRPDVQITGSATYRVGDFAVGAVGKYISSGVLLKSDCDASLTCTPPIPGGFTINDNQVDAQFYLNLNASYDLISRDDGRRLQIYGVVNNVTDVDPPPTGGTQGNSNIYDIIGRVYRVGVRFKY